MTKQNDEWRREAAQYEGQMDAVLLIGQSNMCGRGIIGHVPEIPARDMLFMLRNGHWVPMSEPIQTDRRIYVSSDDQIRCGVSLAASFADDYANRYQRRIGLIPCADGGTRIDQWQPGEVLFDHAVMQAKLAQRSSRIVGILWHQGESDSHHLETVEKYAERFHYMMNTLKAELQLEEDIPVVIGELSMLLEDRCLYIGQTNQVLRQLAAESPHMGIASVEGLTLSPDNIHFSAASYRVLGHRYFEQFDQLVQKKHQA